jgi:hypothetical protein
MLRRIKLLAKHVLAPYLFRYTPPIGLKPERLYAYLDALWQRRKLEGAIVEVGCHLAGTASFAFQMLRRTGYAKRYVCVDTFGGFVPSQFEHDARQRGTASQLRTGFSVNSLGYVRRLLEIYGCPEIELLQADIATVDERLLPEKVIACLVDVDLEEPTYAALVKLYPRLIPGGIALVDDCDTTYDGWKARLGYTTFLRERGLPEQYFLGMGIVRK